MKHTIRWPWAWLIQAIAMLILSALCPILTLALSSTWLEALMRWVILPLAGFVSSLWVTRHGLNCYAAWLVPPIAVSLMPLLIVGFLPPAGSMLLTAFVSLVGAATGDVMNKR